jgi:hypothetical protein
MTDAVDPPNCHFFKVKSAGCALPVGPSQPAAYSDLCNTAARAGNAGSWSSGFSLHRLTFVVGRRPQPRLKMHRQQATGKAASTRAG